jgi:hypothetical protein
MTGRLMNQKYGLLNTILLSLLATFTTPTSAMDTSLLEMSEQMDKVEKQDFQAAIERAASCIRARKFPCAESELAKAAKSATSGQDKKMLLASQDDLKNEKQQLANEIKQAEEERLARLRRAKAEEREAQRRREQERQQMEERIWREQLQAQEAEEEQSVSEYNAAIGQQILQRGAENAAILDNINRQTTAAYAETNRRLAEQAAERERAWADQEERNAERRREARERAAREDAEREEARRRQAQLDAANEARADAQRAARAEKTESVSSVTMSSSSTNNNESRKLYNYTRELHYRGIGRTEQEGCEAARKDAAEGPKIPYVKRVISTGTCSCSEGYSNLNGKALECIIPYTVEVASPYNPDGTYGGPSTGTSK